nr:hypothetical protein OG781_08140 [Streptomyces sp. NBC_00830]
MGSTLLISRRDVSAGTAAGRHTDVDIPATRARCLRVTSTGTAGSWWSLADIRLLRLTPARRDTVLRGDRAAAARRP